MQEIQWKNILPAARVGYQRFSVGRGRSRYAGLLRTMGGCRNVLWRLSGKSFVIWTGQNCLRRRAGQSNVRNDYRKRRSAVWITSVPFQMLMLCLYGFFTFYLDRPVSAVRPCHVKWKRSEEANVQTMDSFIVNNRNKGGTVWFISPCN